MDIGQSGHIYSIHSFILISVNFLGGLLNDFVKTTITTHLSLFLDYSPCSHWLGDASLSLDWSAEFDRIDEDGDGKILFEDFIR